MEKLTYVRACPDKGVVSRYGTGTRERGNVFIGAVRDLEDPRKLVWSDEPVAIPFAEWRKYRREYMRAVEDGALEIVPPPAERPASSEQFAPPSKQSKRS